MGKGDGGKGDGKGKGGGKGGTAAERRGKGGDWKGSTSAQVTRLKVVPKFLQGLVEGQQKKEFKVTDKLAGMGSNDDDEYDWQHAQIVSETSDEAPLASKEKPKTQPQSAAAEWEDMQNREAAAPRSFFSTEAERGPAVKAGDQIEFKAKRPAGGKKPAETSAGPLKKQAKLLSFDDEDDEDE